MSDHKNSAVEKWAKAETISALPTHTSRGYILSSGFENKLKSVKLIV